MVWAWKLKKGKWLRSLDPGPVCREIQTLTICSGSGKSSIIQLIHRFYDPVSGSLLVDGVDMKELNLKWWRQQVSLWHVHFHCQSLVWSVKNQSFLLELLAKIFHLENLEQPRRKFRKLRKLLMRTILFAASLVPRIYFCLWASLDGYGTFVGEKGTQLSGGQKQRIAIVWHHSVKSSQFVGTSYH